MTDERDAALRDLVTAVERYVHEIDEPTRRGTKRAWWRLESLVEMKTALRRAKTALDGES